MPLQRNRREVEPRRDKHWGSLSHAPAYTGESHTDQRPWGWLPAARLSVCLQFHQSLPVMWLQDGWALTSLTGFVALNEGEGQCWPCGLLPLLMLQERDELFHRQGLRGSCSLGKDAVDLRPLGQHLVEGLNLLVLQRVCLGVVTFLQSQGRARAQTRLRPGSDPAPARTEAPQPPGQLTLKIFLA